MTKEFPVPADKVALFDIDGTLIDTNYQVTDPDIFPVIQEAQEKGWTIGLSSDMPYDTMQDRAAYFGTNGPIISEKGARVKFGQLDIEPVPGLGQAFFESRDRIADHFSGRGVVVWHGNPAEVLGGRSLGRVGDAVLLVNARRQYSMSFHIKRVAQDGTLVKETGLTDEIVDGMQPFMPKLDDLHHEKNHDYGVYIVNRRLITKRLGTQALMAATGLTEIAMVGNSYADYVGGDIAKHYAVGDALRPFKDSADYVAEAPVTSGATEILRRLISN